MLNGNLDVVNLHEVAGWARDDSQPDVPISLLIIDNDQFIGRILANRYRADLENAGLGNGRFAFEFPFPNPLQPFERHVVKVCRESDGADLAQSPVVIEPIRVFDASAQQALAEFIRLAGSEADARAKIDFLVSQIELLLQQMAAHDSGHGQRELYRKYLHRWRRTSQHGSAVDQVVVTPRRRALIIDDRVPRPGRDAGSLVILSHMTSLQRLGYDVVFVPAAEFSPTECIALNAIGVECCSSPFYSSVEDVLRRQAGDFDVVYLHRVFNAAKYGELARYYNPKARRIYSVADLHHVRVARQASAEDRPELVARSRWFHFAEHVAAASAHAVVTHSTHEAEILAKKIPRSKIHVALWSVSVKPTNIPLSHRRGVAFIGGYGHEPNLAAAHWLISEIMPMVRKLDPRIECLLVGSDMPEQLRRSCNDGVEATGYVEDISQIFDRVRLTVAPLTYGAGVKGKVIESLAAGVPCVCTPVAAEGLGLPKALRECIGETSERIAQLICELHNQEEVNDTCARAGLDYITETFSNEKLDAAMEHVLSAS